MSAGTGACPVPESPGTQTGRTCPPSWSVSAGGVGCGKEVQTKPPTLKRESRCVRDLGLQSRGESEHWPVSGAPWWRVWPTASLMVPFARAPEVGAACASPHGGRKGATPCPRQSSLRAHVPYTVCSVPGLLVRVTLGDFAIQNDPGKKAV